MTYDLRKILLGGLVTLLFGFGAEQLSAQAIGSIRGTVVDSSQALISGASVVAVNTATAWAASRSPGAARVDPAGRPVARRMA